jgi:hypothetical protein
MNVFKGVALILVGTAWGLLWVTILASIRDLPNPSDTSDIKLIQTALFFVILLGVVPFGFGINRLIR